MPKKPDILLLSDAPGVLGADLDILYPGRVKRLNIVSGRHGLATLKPYKTVITLLQDGSKLKKLNYDAVTAYARAGGQVISCLYEYAGNRGLHFSKTHVMDRFRPAIQIDAETDITRGFSIGDTIWWYGTVSSAPDPLYSNQMYQRQILDVKTSSDVSVLATSNVNDGAVIIEEKTGKGRIVAMDLMSPIRPFYNSWGSTNKYLFLGNAVGGSVRYGKHFPTRLSYDEFVELMFDTAEAHPEMVVEEEGTCSDGRPVFSLGIGDEDRPTAFFAAAIHGWEWENAYGLLRLAEVLCENPRVEGLATRKMHYRIVPIQNPGGFDAFTRQNARGVDLNRNFDCAWSRFDAIQDTCVPWDYNYKGTEAASEPETRIVQGIIDRHKPVCVIDYHTADYIMMLPHKGDGDLIHAIHRDIKRRLKDRYLTQKPYAGPYQQVNMDRITDFGSPQPYCISYAAQRGTPAAFLIEMSGNRDDTHALAMNTDTVVEICLAAIKQVLRSKYIK